ncbi:MAG: YggS family pyridoxal phosphate-dependent enzyme [Candidatus Diapherotrites archaeon]
MELQNVADKISNLNERIKAAAKRAGRNPREIQVLFATKYLSANQIVELAQCVNRKVLIGENIVQDAEKKINELKQSNSWVFSRLEMHFIGHLQSNKAKEALELFDCIQSIDSLKLAGKLNNGAREMGKRLPCYVEVNVSNDPKKFGVKENEVEEIVAAIRKLPNLDLIGLMCIAPFGDPEKTRPYFRLLSSLASRFSLKTSMGMSNDFEVAIEEGSDLIRIGSAVFK